MQSTKGDDGKPKASGAAFLRSQQPYGILDLRC